VYTATPDNVRELRDVVSSAINSHATLLDKPEIGTVVRENTALMFELLRLSRGLPAVVGGEGNDMTPAETIDDSLLYRYYDTESDS